MLIVERRVIGEGAADGADFAAWSFLLWLRNGDYRGLHERGAEQQDGQQEYGAANHGCIIRRPACSRRAVGWDGVPPEVESRVAPVGLCPSLRLLFQRRSGGAGQGRGLFRGGGQGGEVAHFSAWARPRFAVQMQPQPLVGQHAGPLWLAVFPDVA